MTPAFEVNFDGLVGPTHGYAGLSYGNIASFNHRAMVSNPREAALQGLIKARALMGLGLKQGILPPQERPDIKALRRLGFCGTDSQILEASAKQAPEILASMSSASSMWTANAATVSPSADSGDGKVHFTSANLNQKLHRSIEFETTTRILRSIFPSEQHFAHHEALIPCDALGDEGAANHTRLCGNYGEPGLQFFVYGRVALDSSVGSTDAVYGPKRFPARQTIEASQAIARLHQLNPENTVFAQQSAQSIDGGAFHNDVISVGNQNVFFYHETAFRDGEKVIGELKSRYERICSRPLETICVPSKEVSLEASVKSYLFNSQLVTLADGNMALIAPHECEETPSVSDYLKRLVGEARTGLRQVRYFDLRQSMRNGGGPACLRLRVVLNQNQLAATNQGALFSEEKFTLLKKWVETHYRDRLEPTDMRDPKLLNESRTALDELTKLMNLGSIYDFQR